MPFLLIAIIVAIYFLRRPQFVDSPHLLEKLFDRGLEFGFTVIFLVGCLLALSVSLFADRPNHVSLCDVSTWLGLPN
eukprot:SAG22_NODE_15598_length_345_cov_0.630081_2_plen_76_part_01